MRWRENQYLLFSKCVAKINKIETKNVLKGSKHLIGGKGWTTIPELKKVTIIKLRRFSKGNTKNGYSYQANIKLETLDRYYKNSKVRIIPPEEVMRVLLANFEGCMPINDMEMV